MTGMEMYVRFMLTLTIGLGGLGVVLVTLLETLLREWDPILAVRCRWRELTQSRHTGSVRAEDILSELEGRRMSRDRYATRPPVQRTSSPDFVEAL